MMNVADAKIEARKYKGVSIHGNAIRLSFMYQGVRRLETLKNVALTKSNIKTAGGKRAAIVHDIELGKFDYMATFPNSTEAHRVFREENIKKSVPFDLFMDKALKLSENNTRPKTFYNFNNRAQNYVIPAFQGQCLTTITVSDIKTWITEELDTLSNKTIGEVLTPLRATFKLAYDDNLLGQNPMDRISNPKKSKVDNADPFTKEEIHKLGKTNTSRKIEQLAVTIACWTGLRPSELLAVSLDDIDFTTNTLTVKRSVVKGSYAATKTDGSYRTIELLDQAIESLEQLIALRGEIPITTTKVLERDNRRYGTEELQFIIVSSESGKPWSGNESFSKMIMKPLCKLANVRYRPIGQTRHTYGSQLITAEMPLKWIAEQMGHTSIKMLEKHYGRWMKSEAPDMAKKASMKVAA